MLRHVVSYFHYRTLNAVQTQTLPLPNRSKLVCAFTPFNLRMETDTVCETLCSFHSTRQLASYNGSNTKNQLCFCGIETRSGRTQTDKRNTSRYTTCSSWRMINTSTVLVWNRLTAKIGWSTTFKGQTVLNVSCEYLRQIFFFYVHGSMYRESNLITVQQDATYSVYYISAGSSTCFGCWHPSSEACTTVITDSGID